ncbi:MAG: hypothetical protein ACI4XD_05655, partial [Clostridia bacterium]
MENQMRKTPKPLTMRVRHSLFYKMSFGISKNTLLLFILLTAILFIGIGHATINSITGEIKGEVIATV